MSRIDELIQQLCPDGVEYKPLGEVAKRNKGISITASKMKEIEVPGGPYRVFAAGQTQVDTTAEHIPVEKLITEPSIIVKARGYIAFEYCVRPFTHKSEIWSYTVTDPRIDQRFVYHYLLAQEDSLRILAKSKSVKLPQLATGDTDRISIPVPPLEVQQEIVRVLDAFTELEANLQRELDARKRQYEHYRDELTQQLCPDGVEYKPLGDMVEVRSGWGFPNAEQGITAGDYPFFKVGDMNLPGNELEMKAAQNYVSKETAAALKCKPAPKGTVIFPKIGAAIKTNKKRVLSCDACYDNNVMGLVPASSELNPRFLHYVFDGVELYDLANDSGAVPSIRKSDVERFQIPVPSLEVQQEIVTKLDAMVALQDNLQRQINLTHKQYEYYRDKLLDLPKKVA